MDFAVKCLKEKVFCFISLEVIYLPPMQNHKLTQRAREKKLITGFPFLPSPNPYPGRVELSKKKHFRTFL